MNFRARLRLMSAIREVIFECGAERTVTFDSEEDAKEAMEIVKKYAEYAATPPPITIEAKK